MARKERLSAVCQQGRGQSDRGLSRTQLKSVIDWMIPPLGLSLKMRVHGNVRWRPEQLAVQALIWSWQAAKNVTDAFAEATEICAELIIGPTAKSYTTFMDALVRYNALLSDGLRQRFQDLAEQVAGPLWQDSGWVLIAFDGSRGTTPRSVSNEREFCAANYGHGKTAKYRKKKTQGMRRRKNERNKPQPPPPQVWMTMMWHMGLRLPWTWRLGPSTSSERAHVMEILEHEEFPKNTLFCGDAGFVGYDFWSKILRKKCGFLVRVGGNVQLLSQQADVQQLGGGRVLCWPKDKMHAGHSPLELRLVRVPIGATKMWMLTSVLDRKKLTDAKIVKYYKLRWGVEVEFRGLKQTFDKATLRCRNKARVYVELDWSIRAMAFAELIALREQLGAQKGTDYDPKDRSLANTMRTLRTCMRSLHKYADPNNGLLTQLSNAKVQRYRNGSDKRARYRVKNPDKKPLGDPTIRKLTRQELKKLQIFNHNLAA